MLSAANLRQLRHMKPAHTKNRTRAARAAGFEVAQRLNIFNGQQLRRDLAVDGKRRAARVRLPEARTQGHHLFAEGRDALAPDGKSGGKLMSAVAFKQAGQLLQRPEQVEPAVGPRRGLALVAVEADEERRAAVFLRHAGGHDAHHALMPALVRQHDRLRRPAGREHGDSGLINAAFDLLPPAVEAAERARQLDRASRVVRQKQLCRNSDLTHASGCIDARGKRIADGARRDRPLLHGAFGHQRRNADAPRVLQRL